MKVESLLHKHMFQTFNIYYDSYMAEMNPKEVGIKWSEMKFGGTDEAILHALPILDRRCGSSLSLIFGLTTALFYPLSFQQFGRRCSSLRPSRILLSN